MNRESGRRGLLGLSIKGIPLTDLLLMPQRHGDMFARVAAWGTAYDSKMRELSSRSDLTDTQKNEQAGAFAEDIVNQSQSAATFSDRTLMQKTNEFVKQLTPFTGQQIKDWNILNRHMYQPMKKAWKTGARTGGAWGGIGEVMQVVLGTERAKADYGVARGAGQVFAFTFVVPAMALSLMARGRPPEDFEEFMTDLTAYLAMTVPLIGPPIAMAMIAAVLMTGGSPFAISQLEEQAFDPR
jgi:hypothetical protein